MDSATDPIVVVDEEEIRGRGRPTGIKTARRSRLALLGEPLSASPRRNRNTSFPSPATASPSPSPTSSRTPSRSPATPRGTSSRPSYYLLGKAPSSLSKAKLPKLGPILARIISISAAKSHKKDHLFHAIMEVVEEILEIWCLHFPYKWIHGKIGEKIIMDDKHDNIRRKLQELHYTWRKLQKKRAEGKADMEAKKSFQEKISMPFDIRVKNYKDIMRDSGVLDWEEDVTYLDGQMSKEQPGNLGSLDTQQLKYDNKREAARMRQEAKRMREEAMLEKRLEKEESAHLEAEAKEKAFYDDEEAEEEEEKDDVDDDEEFEDDTVKNWMKSNKPKKIDVMGAIAKTADARNISQGDSTFLAAATANVLGIDLDNTNISKTSARRRGRVARLKTSKKIREDFLCPNKTVLHWDGKTLKLRGRVTSSRVAVYLSGLGAPEDQLRKLLGIPEAKDGTGSEEFHIVQKCLETWEVKEQVVGLVFDTTATNTGKEKGCCR